MEAKTPPEVQPCKGEKGARLGILLQVLTVSATGRRSATGPFATPDNNLEWRRQGREGEAAGQIAGSTLQESAVSIPSRTTASSEVDSLGSCLQSFKGPVDGYSTLYRPLPRPQWPLPLCHTLNPLDSPMR